MKNFILDTNIFLYEPNCVFLFEEHDLYITPVTLRELNDLKDRPGEAGYAARRARRVLSGIIENNNLKSGIPLGKGLGRLHVITETDFSDFAPGMTKTKNDDFILATAAYMKKNMKNADVILVSDDIDMIFFADILGVKTERFRNKRDESTSKYTGREFVSVNAKKVNRLLSEGFILTSDIGNFHPNEFLTLTDGNGRQTLARVSGDGKKIELLNVNKLPGVKHPYGITPRNNGQKFLISALMNPNIPLVIASGPAGTAKTFVTLACGLQQVVNGDTYKSILITRANVEMDASYGYLPGTETEKIMPMMRPFIDNLNILSEKENKKAYKDGRKCPSVAEYLIDSGTVQAEAMQYMRGRSIKDTYVVIDEAQNCTPNQILSIVSRVGVGSKIVLLGDPEQIDNKLLDSRNNGLVFAAARFLGSALCAQIVMSQEECVRSPLAAEAAQRLK